MDPAIAASIIGGAFLIVTTVISTYYAIIRKTDGLPGQDPPSQKFSYTIERFSQTVTILNGDGDCRFERTYGGIRVNPGVSLHEIQGFFRSDPTGTVTKLPRKTFATNVGSLVEVHSSSVSPYEAKFSIEIAGGLAHGDQPLDLGIETEMTRALRVKRDVIRRDYATSGFRSEFVGVEVDLPIDELVLEVRFPMEFSLEVFPTAFRTGTEEVVHDERRRIQSGLDRSTPGTAIVSIRKPRLGHLYVLYWSGV